MNIPILMYHEIIDKVPSLELSRKIQRSYLVSKNDFEEQVAYLKERGYHTIDLHDVTDAPGKEKKIIGKPIAITFDDGYEGNYLYALPILKKYNAISTFFITVGMVGKSCMLSWAQAYEMKKEGMSIQSHTVSHPLLTAITPREVECELLNSKLIIEEKMGSVVDFISYPNGDYNSAVMAHVRKAGYEGACSSEFGFNSLGSDGFALRRIKIPNSFSIRDFGKILDNNWKTCFFLTGKDLVFHSVRGLVGSKNYEKIYSKIFDLKE